MVAGGGGGAVVGGGGGGGKIGGAGVVGGEGGVAAGGAGGTGGAGNVPGGAGAVGGGVPGVAGGGGGGGTGAGVAGGGGADGVGATAAPCVIDTKYRCERHDDPDTINVANVGRPTSVNSCTVCPLPTTVPLLDDACGVNDVCVVRPVYMVVPGENAGDNATLPPLAETVNDCNVHGALVGDVPEPSMKNDVVCGKHSSPGSGSLVPVARAAPTGEHTNERVGLESVFAMPRGKLDDPLRYTTPM
jgi:hypothetical protein